MKPQPSLLDIIMDNAMLASTPQLIVAAPETHAEPCRKCRGKGVRWFGRGNPPVMCGTCKGLGARTYKATAEKRAHTREVAKARKAKKLAEAVAEFQIQHPAIWQWMNASAFPFAGKMKDALTKWGTLTERQLSAAQKCVRRDP